MGQASGSNNSQTKSFNHTVFECSNSIDEKKEQDLSNKNEKSEETMDNVYLYIYISLHNKDPRSKNKNLYNYEAWVVYKGHSKSIAKTSLGESKNKKYLEDGLLQNLYEEVVTHIKNILFQEDSKFIRGKAEAIATTVIIEVFLDKAILHNDTLVGEVEKWLIGKDDKDMVGSRHTIVIRSSRALQHINEYELYTIGLWRKKWETILKIYDQSLDNKNTIVIDKENNVEHCVNNFIEEKLDNLINDAINIICINYKEKNNYKVYITYHKYSNVEELCKKLKPHETICCILINEKNLSTTPGKVLLKAAVAGIPVVMWLKRHITTSDCKKLMEIFFPIKCLPETVFEKRKEFNFNENTAYKVIDEISLLWDDVNRIPIEDYTLQ